MALLQSFSKLSDSNSQIQKLKIYNWKGPRRNFFTKAKPLALDPSSLPHCSTFSDFSKWHASIISQFFVLKNEKKIAKILGVSFDSTNRDVFLDVFQWPIFECLCHQTKFIFFAHTQYYNYVKFIIKILECNRGTVRIL